jgi:site-specific DNA-cytosine methylase
MTETTYTALFPFGGSGGGALGFAQAETRLFDRSARFAVLGSLDFDAAACVDFEAFTGAPAWCVDVQTLTAGEVLRRYGLRAPDVVFLSPPCKGSSRLLSTAKSKDPKYVAMNRLAVVWTRVMLEAWGDAPPKLVLLENVPGLPQRAGGMLRELRSMLKAAGYVFHASTHDCGEIGGLAQHRERYLLVARHTGSCSSLLYKPVTKRVRGVGEVLGELPMPATIAADLWDALHTMPRLTWRNWLRLALIPAGGDWRDLEGVLEGRARREVFRRHAVQAWDAPTDAVTGPGGHSIGAVADPRVEDVRVPVGYDAAYGVLAWDAPARTVAGNTAAGCGAYAVADGRERLAVNARVLTLDEAMALDLDPMKAPPFIPLIVAEDGTWHRPLTLLELAALQGYPTMVDGKPVRFEGGRTAIAEHIGNSVPPPAARGIAEQMLMTLLTSEAGSWTMGTTGVWTTPTNEQQEAA